MANNYSNKEYEPPVDAAGRTWEGFHAAAVRRLRGGGNAPMTASRLVAAGRQRNADVVYDLCRAKVLEGVVGGSVKTVVVKKYRLREGV